MTTEFKGRGITAEEEERRNQMLGITSVQWELGRFTGCSGQTMRELINMGLADPQETQNSSPELETMVEFCEQTPGAYLHGYTVERARFDCRVTAEGVGVVGKMTRDRELEFIQLFRDADEFDLDDTGAYCWYD